MSTIVSLGIVLLSGLVTASLQLPLGTLLLLYHASLGKNIPKKTKCLVSSFIAGVTIMFFLLLSASCFIISALTFSGQFSVASLIILVSILIALAIIAWFFYYRRKNTTELWLPRKVSSFIDGRAKITKDNSEAFSLGLLVVLAELLFTAPLLALSADAILCIESIFQIFCLVIFTCLSVLPLVILRFSIRNGKNLADIQRWRIKNKNFFRIFSGFGFAILAAFITVFLIIGGD